MSGSLYKKKTYRYGITEVRLVLLFEPWKNYDLFVNG